MYENINNILVRNVESHSNLFGMKNFKLKDIFSPKKTAKKVMEKTRKDFEQKAEQEQAIQEAKKSEAKKRLRKAMQEAQAKKAEAEAQQEAIKSTSPVETETLLEEPEKKFLGMKRGIGIPVAIVGGLVIIGGLTFLIIKIAK